MNEYLILLSRALSSIEFCFLVIYFHNNLYQKKFANFIYFVYTFIFILISLFIHFLNIPLINVFFTITSIFFTSAFFYKSTWKKIGVCNTIFFVTLLVVEMVVSAIFSVFSKNIMVYLLDGELFFVSSIVILILNISCCKILVCKLGKNRYNSIQWMDVLFSVVLCLFETASLICLADISEKSDKRAYTLVVFGFGYLFIICYQLYTNHIKQLAFENEKKLAIENNNRILLDKHYEIVEEKNKRYRKLEHDIYKHINTINSLIQGSNFDIASKYINDVKAEFQSVKENYILKNKILQILINDLYQKAADHDIICKFDIVDLELSFFSSYDLTTLFGNLFDNALEACLKTHNTQRYIYIHLYKFNDYIIFQICNSYEINSDSVLNCEKSIEFTEAEKDIGLENVSEVINKYHGHIDIFRTDKKFDVKIVIPAPY